MKNVSYKFLIVALYVKIKNLHPFQTAKPSFKKISLGLKVPLLRLEPSCPLQTILAILLSDLVGCDSPLQIVLAVCLHFFEF